MGCGSPIIHTLSMSPMSRTFCSISVSNRPTHLPPNPKMRRLSPRTPVMQNDPLGALVEETAAVTVAERRLPTDVRSPSAPPPSTDKQQLHNNNHMYSDQPILFKGQRSATFDESVHLGKMHRSETMPAATLTSSLAGLGSSLKFSFG